MSRVGNRILTIPAGVEIIFNNNEVTVLGQLGKLSRTFAPQINIEARDGKIYTTRSSELKQVKQLHGTTNSLLQGMLTGVSVGFKKELRIKGVGYRVALKDQQLELLVGYSHPVLVDVPTEIKVELPNATTIIVSGIDKQKVGEFAAQLRAVRKPNAYSGKGVSYADEVLKLKEGKKASK